jgi:hypothetical protein
MTNYTPGNQDFALPLIISQNARQTAAQFARQQPTPEKAHQVQLNTLAVYAVHDYLSLLGVESQLTGDSWNPVVQLCADVADLQLAGLGKLECRPVTATADNPPQICPVPPEVWEERIGYVVVQFDDAYQEASLLGFTPAAAVEELPLRQLQPPEDLFDHLAALQQPQTVTAGESLRIRLGRWLQGAIDDTWQTVDALLNPAQLSPAYAFRSLEGTVEEGDSAIRRAKRIELPPDHPLALVVRLDQPDASAEVNILIQLHPLGGQPHLPQNVILRVLDEAGSVFLEAQSREMDDYVQLQLSGTTGEGFQVQVALGTDSVTESFVI